MDKLKAGVLLVVFLFAVSSLIGFAAKETSPIELRNQIAVIKLYGEIGAVSGISSSGMDVDAVKSLLKEAAESPTVAAIVLDVNSPGGGAASTYELVRAIESAKEKKPIVSYISETGASGGYWIAVAADRIVVSPLAITGSIGVVSEFIEASQLLSKLGIHFETIKTGKYKDEGSIARPLTEEEKAMMLNLTMKVHDMFVKSIAEHRNLPEEKVRELAQGQIFLGKDAVEYGLADEAGTKEDAINLASKLGNVEKPEITELEPRKTWQDLIGEMFGTFGYGLGQGFAAVLQKSSLKV